MYNPHSRRVLRNGNRWKMVIALILIMISISTSFVATNDSGNSRGKGFSKQDVSPSAMTGSVASISTDQYITYDLNILPQWQSASFTTGSYSGGSTSSTALYGSSARGTASALYNSIVPSYNTALCEIAATGTEYTYSDKPYNDYTSSRTNDGQEFMVEDWTAQGWPYYWSEAIIDCKMGVWSGDTGSSSSPITTTSYLTKYRALSGTAYYVNGAFEWETTNYSPNPIGDHRLMAIWQASSFDSGNFDLWSDRPNPPDNGALVNLINDNYGSGYGFSNTAYPSYLSYTDRSGPNFDATSNWYYKAAVYSDHWVNKVNVGVDVARVDITEVTSASVDCQLSKTINPPAGYSVVGLQLIPTDLWLPPGVNLYQGSNTLISSTGSLYESPITLSTTSNVVLHLQGTNYGDIASYSNFDVSDLNLYCTGLKLRVTIMKTQSEPVTFDASKANTLYSLLGVLDNPSTLSFEHASGTVHDTQIVFEGVYTSRNLVLQNISLSSTNYVPVSSDFSTGTNTLTLGYYSGSTWVDTSENTWINNQWNGVSSLAFTFDFTGNPTSSYFVANSFSIKALGRGGTGAAGTDSYATLTKGPTTPGIIKDEWAQIQFKLSTIVANNFLSGIYGITYWFTSTGYTSPEYSYTPSPGGYDSFDLSSGTITIIHQLSFSTSGAYSVYMQIKKFDTSAKTNLYQTVVLKNVINLFYDKYTFSNVITPSTSGGYINWGFGLSSITGISARDVFVAAVSEGDTSSTSINLGQMINSNLMLDSVSTDYNILFPNQAITETFDLKTTSGTQYVKVWNIAVMSTTASTASLTNAQQNYLMEKINSAPTTISTSDYAIQCVLDPSIAADRGNAPLRFEPYMIALQIGYGSSVSGPWTNWTYFSTDSSHRSYSNSIIFLGMPLMQNPYGGGYFDTEGRIVDQIYIAGTSASTFTATDAIPIKFVENPYITSLFAETVAENASSTAWQCSCYPAFARPTGLARPQVSWQSPITADGSSYSPNIYDSVTMSAIISDADGFNKITYMDYYLKNSTTFLIPRTAFTMNPDSGSTTQGTWQLNLNMASYKLTSNSQYIFYLNIKDQSGHIANKTCILIPISYPVTFTSITSPTVSSWNYYAYMPFQIVLNDPDGDIDPAIHGPGSNVSVQIRNSSGVVSTYPLSLVSYAGSSYTFANSSTMQALLWKGGKFKDGNYQLVFIAQDKYGNVASQTLSFSIWSSKPYLDPNFQISPDVSQSYTDIQSITCALRVKDDDIIGVANPIYGDLSPSSGAYARVWIENASFPVSNPHPFTSPQYVVNLVYNPSIQSWDFTYDGSGAGFSTIGKNGQYMVHMEVVDGYGNVFEEDRRVVVNPAVPVITPQTPIQGSNLDTYSNKLVKITVDDPGNDIVAATVEARITNYRYGGQYSTGWVPLSQIGTTDEFQYTFPYQTGLMNGPYTISYAATDARGHTTNLNISVGFTSIPSTLTILQPSASSGTPTYGKYQTINIQVLVNSPDNDVSQGNVKAQLLAPDFESPTMILTKGSGLNFYGQCTASSGLMNETMQLVVNVTDAQSYFYQTSMNLNLVVNYPVLSKPTPQGNIFSYKSTIPVGLVVNDKDNDISMVQYKVVSRVTGFTYDSGWRTLSWTGYANYNDSFDASPLIKNGLYQVMYQAEDVNGIISLQTANSFFTIQNGIPAVTIQNPTNMQVFNYNSPITVLASITDTDNDIKSVTFSLYNATIFLANNVSMTWITGNTWTIVQKNANPNRITNGTFIVLLNATDAIGQSTIKMISISIYNYVPIIESVAPVDGSTFSYQNITQFRIGIMDQDNDIISVLLQSIEKGSAMNHTLSKTIPGINSTWAYNFNFGNHTALHESPIFTIFVIDAYGHRISSNLDYNIVNYAPVVSRILLPLNNTIFFTADTVSIKANVTDKANDLQGVNAYLTLLGSSYRTPNYPMVFVMMDSAWECSIGMKPYRNQLGTWVVVVNATSVHYSTANSSITIQLENAPPTLVITSPIASQELTTSFTITAAVTDRDFDLVAAWYSFGLYAPRVMANATAMNLLTVKFQANVNLWTYSWGSYILTVSANDSAGQIAVQTVSVYLHPPETITITASQISYQQSGVSASTSVGGTTLQATIMITHDQFLKSLDCRLILPATWTDIVFTATDYPSIRRGQTTYADINLGNVTYMVFQRFSSWQKYDQVYFDISPPILSDQGVSTDQDGNTQYAFQMTTKRFYSNISVSDLSIPVTAQVSTYQFKFEVQIGANWIDLTTNATWGFHVTGAYSALASFTVPEIHYGDQINIRIVKIPIPSNSINTTPFFYGAMLGGGIGGLCAVVLFALKKRYDWDNEGITSNKTLAIISIAIITVLFLVGVFAFGA